MTQSISMQFRGSVTPQVDYRERIKHMFSFKALLWIDV